MSTTHVVLYLHHSRVWEFTVPFGERHPKTKLARKRVIRWFVKEFKMHSSRGLYTRVSSMDKWLAGLATRGERHLTGKPQ